MSKREIDFKERMKGHIAFDETRNALVDKTVDGNGWVAMRVVFDMHVDDVDAFWKGDHVGTIAGGKVICKELGDCRVTGGDFRLLWPIAGDEYHQHMKYHVHFLNGNGDPLTLSAYKEVIAGGFNWFEDTTATLTRIHTGTIDYTDSSEMHPVASGVLRVGTIYSVGQVFSFSSAEVGKWRAIPITVNFVSKFFWHLWKVYGPGWVRAALR
jgi:hypothetical protein